MTAERPDPRTPRELLTEAVHAWCESVGSCSHSRYPDQGPDECDEMTGAFIEDAAGARLLALAETGAAAREWAMAGDVHTPVIHIYPDGSGTVYLQAVSGGLVGDRYDFDDWRLTEAVAAALEDRDDE